LFVKYAQVCLGSRGLWEAFLIWFDDVSFSCLQKKKDHLDISLANSTFPLPNRNAACELKRM
jgi:hypothetical protein